MLEAIRAIIVGQEGSKREGQAGRWGRRFHPEVNRGKRRGRKGVWGFEGGDLGIVSGGRGYWRWEREGCVCGNGVKTYQEIISSTRAGNLLD